MGLPLLGIGARLLGGTVKKLAGKAVRWATRGKLIGSGGGRELAKRAGQAVGATVGTAVVARATDRILTRRAEVDPYGPSVPMGDGTYMYPDGATGLSRVRLGAPGRRYRRINPANGRALRRAMRRLDAAEKIFKKVFRFNHGKAPTNVRLRGK